MKLPRLLLSLTLVTGGCASMQTGAPIFGATSDLGSLNMTWIAGGNGSGPASVTIANTSSAELCAYRDFQSNDGSQLVAAQFRHMNGGLSDDLGSGFIVPQDLTPVAIRPGQSFVFRHSFVHLPGRRAAARGNPIVAMRISLFLERCGSINDAEHIRLVSPWIEMPTAS